MIPLDSIVCGCAEEVLATFPGACIDLTVTSPPYDNLRTYNGYTFDFETMARQLYRITKPGGVVVWVVGDETRDGSESGTSFRQALGFMEIGFKLHDTMIYEKMGTHPNREMRYPNMFEYMFVLCKGKLSTFHPYRKARNKKAGQFDLNRKRQRDGEVKIYGSHTVPDESTDNNVWRYAVGYMTTTPDVFAYGHMAMFPEKLAEDHILSWSNAGDLVLDPMCGSGTTCKMAIRHHRHFIGIDISEDYCQLARRRISAVQETLL